MKKIIFLTILLILVLAAQLFQFVLTPNPKTTIIYFENGSSLRHIAHTLEKEGVITQARLFEWVARSRGEEKSLRAGEYEFEAGLKPAQILEKMVKGQIKIYPMTIPEGFNLADIGKLAVARGITTPEEWSQLITQSPTPLEGNPLEGYLFPDTYFIERRTRGIQLIDAMVGLFKKKITPEFIQKAAEKGFTLHQWVTLASLIEKETGVAAERPLIASVFINRLQKNMLLQTDPSVIYGIPNFDGNLTHENLQTPNPYNTYLNAGLPKGPICSPGMGSFMAVLNAPQTEYLYFVAKGDGTHYFSKTLEEHQQAVNYYQLHQGTPP